MSTLFISDLHLAGERPRIISLFEAFLEQQASRADALYILGDLFEVWLGDDLVTPDIQPVLDALRRLTDGGVPVHVMTGNRDFLLGEGFAARTGCRLLAEPGVIELYGSPILLLHGDTLCTDDHDYQAFRRQVRDPAWQRGFLAKSQAERIAYARQAREESRARTRDKPEQIMDVNPAAVVQAFERHDVRRMIHGHTHRPAVHEVKLGEHHATRIVLGDWYDQASVLTINPDGFHLTGNPRSNWY